MAAFVLVESRLSAPMVPLSLFRSSTFAGVNLLTLLLYGALGGALFLVPFDLIQVQGLQPDARLGAMQLPTSVAVRVAAERGKLGGAQLDIASAFVAGFRTVMLAGAALAVLGGVAGWLMVRNAERPPVRS